MAGTPPGKTWISGLEFTDQVYVNLATKATADIKRAHEIITEKLPLLGQLKAVISLTLGDHQPVFLDARSGEAKLIDKFEGEPTTILNMKAECKMILTLLEQVLELVN